MAAIWYSNTQGNPGSILAIQNDGNLVIYSPTGVPVWNIGVDTGWANPTKKGDVIGRDLNVPGVSWVGHIALWDGSRVIEVLNQSGNAVHFNSIDTFKNTSPYWGVASPNIAPGWQKSWCYEAFCNGDATRIILQSRDAVGRGAYQAYLIGASYTLSENFKTVIPATTYEPAQRGIYRCDTFVIDMFWYSYNYESLDAVYLTQDQRRWVSQIKAIAGTYATYSTPKATFDSLKLAQ